MCVTLLLLRGPSPSQSVDIAIPGPLLPVAVVCGSCASLRLAEARPAVQYPPVKNLRSGCVGCRPIHDYRRFLRFDGIPFGGCDHLANDELLDFA